MDDLTSTSLPANTLSIYGTGVPPGFVNPGASSLASDDCVQFSNGQGFVSANPLNNVGWTGTAMSIWYNSLSTYQGNILQGAYLGFGMRMLTNGRVQATFDGSAAGSYNSTFAINDGNWHHIVAQNNGTVTEIYIDGVLDLVGNEPLYTLSSPHPSAKIYLGAAFGDLSSEKIYGKVDEIKVYDNILSQAQIDALYAYAPCLVTIPDANFKNYLVGNAAINTNSDTEISCDEAAVFTGSIIVQGLSISDLTGIEAFPLLTGLNCAINNLTTLNLDANTELENLYCDNNSLTTLDISQNTQLVWLNASYNDLTTLNVLTNVALENLIFEYNDITALNISNNSLLEYVNGQSNDLTTFMKGTHNYLGSLYLGNNNFTSIDVSDLPAIYTISLLSNNLTSINVNNCPNLAYLYLHNNNLTSIDLSSALALESIYISGNSFTSLDLSNLPYMHECIAENNDLYSLNIKNGNNSTIATNYFKANGNPNLVCIDVDDIAYSTTNWTFIDNGATFTTDCATWLGTNNLEQMNLSIYPNPVIDILTLSSESTIVSATIFDINGNVLDTFKGTSYSTSKLDAGVYFITVKSHLGLSQMKFIKL